MDKQFAPLISRNLPRSGGGLTLSGVNRGGTTTASGPNGPSPIMRNNMLIAFRHISLLI